MIECEYCRYKFPTEEDLYRHWDITDRWNHYLLRHPYFPHEVIWSLAWAFSFVLIFGVKW